jgi:16S rRNA (uracil1498-N3)-methyltransferase
LRVPLSSIASGVAPLPPEAAHYVVRVHRLRPGDRLVVFDPDQAIEAEATLIEASPRGAAAEIGPLRPASLTPRRRMTLIQAVGKGDKMDAIVRDATELGVTRIIPALADRCLARPEADRAARWRRIAVEAARQCGRGDAPRIDAPMALAEARARARGVEEGLCLDPRAAVPLGARLRGLGAAAEVAFVVGPEGGLTEDEMAACAAEGFARVRLGRLTLRTETACAAALGALAALEEGG